MFLDGELTDEKRSRSAPPRRLPPVLRGLRLRGRAAHRDLQALSRRGARVAELKTRTSSELQAAAGTPDLLRRLASVCRHPLSGRRCGCSSTHSAMPGMVNRKPSPSTVSVPCFSRSLAPDESWRVVRPSWSAMARPVAGVRSTTRRATVARYVRWVGLAADHRAA